MSNHPDQPQPYTGEPAESTPPGYNAPVVPPRYPVPAPKDMNSGENQQYRNPQDPNLQDQYAQPAPYGQQQVQNPPLAQYSQPQYQQPQYQQQYPPPAYYQGGPGYVVPNSGPRGMSLASMIIGLTSLFLLGWFIVPQIVGIVLGHMGLKKESPQGKAFSITGLITNYLALLVWGGIYLFYIFIIVAVAGTSGSDFSRL
ncbi:DUF4190 domain-containing protein [Arthrobacter sp. H35-D1]|uniref:DUF4190 domain-containing protein n=1 Tax=Arthrobacter sp. H35-D1 TaxID=3046202 RepID=UPI0024BBC9F3|nr:DUF4190 domain-containing protein [Arthrobacter sp. H35-D1]MDJ0312174.1 DUF4190 domain-containing protein [Arthrobacter sp. H35-D1]